MTDQLYNITVKVLPNKGVKDTVYGTTHQPIWAETIVKIMYPSDTNGKMCADIWPLHVVACVNVVAVEE